MDNYDPFETVHQLRAWVEKSLSSLRSCFKIQIWERVS